jgi:hypothetical protein
VTIFISGSLLLVQTADKFGGMEYKRSDILSLHLVDNISAGTFVKAGKKQGNTPADMKRKFAIQSSSRNNPEAFDQSVVLTYTASQSTRTLKLLCSHSAHLVSALRYALIFDFCRIISIIFNRSFLFNYCMCFSFVQYRAYTGPPAKSSRGGIKMGRNTSGSPRRHSRNAAAHWTSEPFQ